MTDTINPKDPVAVLRAAAQKLEARRNDPRFVIDMGCYHNAVGTPCRICLAGAVMCGLAGEKGMLNPLLHTGKFGKDWSESFKALDMFRQGSVSYYLSSFGIDNSALFKAHKQFDGMWNFEGELSPQEVDELISHCRTVADWLEDQGRKDNE